MLSLSYVLELAFKEHCTTPVLFFDKVRRSSGVVPSLKELSTILRLVRPGAFVAMSRRKSYTHFGDLE